MVVTDVVHPKTGEAILSEVQIKQGIAKLEQMGWLGEWAYILHDKDVYDEDDVAETEERKVKADNANPEACDGEQKKAADENQNESEKPAIAVGMQKPAHWHIALSGKRGKNHKQKQARVSSIAKAFGLPEQFVHLTRIDSSMSMPHMLAYLVHDPDESNTDGKFEYPHEELKTNISHWEERIQIMLESGGTAKTDEYIIALQNRILCGKLTVKQAVAELLLRIEIDPKDDAFTKMVDKLYKCRRIYLSEVAPMPSVRTNMYICGPAGSGKTQNAYAWAMSLFPDIKEPDEIFYKVGDPQTPFDKYDGQPVVIWDDKRPGTILKITQGRSGFYQLFDTHPNNVKTTSNVKYSHLVLTNCINIVTCVLPFWKFANGIDHPPMKYDFEEDDPEEKVEDINQVTRRFPAFLEITDEGKAIFRVNKGVSEHNKRYLDQFVAVATWNNILTDALDICEENHKKYRDITIDQYKKSGALEAYREVETKPLGMPSDEEIDAKLYARLGIKDLSETVGDPSEIPDVVIGKDRLIVLDGDEKEDPYGPGKAFDSNMKWRFKSFMESAKSDPNFAENHPEIVAELRQLVSIPVETTTRVVEQNKPADNAGNMNGSEVEAMQDRTEMPHLFDRTVINAINNPDLPF